MLAFRILLFGGPLRRILAAVVVASVLVSVSGCSHELPPVSAKVQQYYDENVKNAQQITAAKVITFAAVGDSVTEADSPDIVNGMVGDGSWINYAGGDGVGYMGGWADGGAKSSAMLANVKPVKADVVVVLAGTNDFGNGVPFEESAANIEAITKKVGAKRIVVSAIPPNNHRPADAATYNENLQAFAKTKGWRWVDSAVKIRTPENTYLPGMTMDGTHPTVAGAKLIGASIRAAILAK